MLPQLKQLKPHLKSAATVLLIAILLFTIGLFTSTISPSILFMAVGLLFTQLAMMYFMMIRLMAEIRAAKGNHNNHFWVTLLEERKNGFEDDTTYSGKYAKSIIQGVISRMK